MTTRIVAHSIMTIGIEGDNSHPNVPRGMNIPINGQTHLALPVVASLTMSLPMPHAASLRIGTIKSILKAIMSGLLATMNLSHILIAHVRSLLTEIATRDITEALILHDLRNQNAT